MVYRDSEGTGFKESVDDRNVRKIETEGSVRKLAKQRSPATVRHREMPSTERNEPGKGQASGGRSR